MSNLKVKTFFVHFCRGQKKSVFICLDLWLNKSSVSRCAKNPQPGNVSGEKHCKIPVHLQMARQWN